MQSTIDISSLAQFSFVRLLDEDPITRSVTLLGTLNSDQAIIRVEKTALDAESCTNALFGENGMIQKVEILESTDIYTWMLGWFGQKQFSDVKINIICPATDVHIRKYTKQEQILVRETPAIYERIVKPYILAFPPARTQWVRNILTGVSEQSKVLFQDSSFVLLPDMKWDLKTVQALYLVAIAKDEKIRCLRDLTKDNLPMLKHIRRGAEKVANEKWSITPGGLRMWVHYQPSYYHFHVHIVNANSGPTMGMAVGQAHLLDDIISLLELDPDPTPHMRGIFQKMTLTYGLGDQHGLFVSLRDAQEEGEES